MTKERLHAFAQLLTNLREKAGLSIYALAKRAGMTRQGLSLLESGQREPGWETVQRLAMALDVSCEAFTDPSLSLPEIQPPGRPGRPPLADAGPRPTVRPAKPSTDAPAPAKKRGRPRKA